MHRATTRSVSNIIFIDKFYCASFQRRSHVDDVVCSHDVCACAIGSVAASIKKWMFISWKHGRAWGKERTKSSFFDGQNEREPPGTMFNLEFIFIDNLILEIPFLVHTFRNRIAENRVRIDDSNGQSTMRNYYQFCYCFFLSLFIFPHSSSKTDLCFQKQISIFAVAHMCSVLGRQFR